MFGVGLVTVLHDTNPCQTTYRVLSCAGGLGLVILASQVVVCYLILLSHGLLCTAGM